MKKPVGVLVGLAMLSTPAFGQVRPQDCRPVLPVVDQVAAVPQDVIGEPPATLATAAKRRFFGLPFLFPALLALGGVGALIGTGDTGTAADDTPISPA